MELDSQSQMQITVLQNEVETLKGQLGQSKLAIGYMNDYLGSIGAHMKTDGVIRDYQGNVIFQPSK